MEVIRNPNRLSINTNRDLAHFEFRRRRSSLPVILLENVVAVIININQASLKYRLDIIIGSSDHVQSLLLVCPCG